jgi:hypothetical protein
MKDVVGICGLIGSGKGTVGDILVDEFGYTKLSFADKLKDGVASIFDWDREMLEGATKDSREWRETTDEFWSSETGFEVTPRLVLQLFGTDCMRNGFFDGVWVSLVKKTIIDNPGKKFVLPDVRFVNEMQAIKDVNGEIWQVRRGELPAWFEKRRDHGGAVANVHPSEWEWILSDSNYNLIISNNSTLEHLYSTVQSSITA